MTTASITAPHPNYKFLQAAIEAMQDCGQRQDPLDGQLATCIRLAKAAGCHKAAKHLWRVLRSIDRRLAVAMLFEGWHDRAASSNEPRYQAAIQALAGSQVRTDDCYAQLASLRMLAVGSGCYDADDLIYGIMGWLHRP